MIAGSAAEPSVGQTNMHRGNRMFLILGLAAKRNVRSERDAMEWVEALGDTEG